MSLRARLAIAVALLGIVLASSALVILSLVQTSLVDAIDHQLASAARIAGGPPVPPGVKAVPVPLQIKGTTSPFTDVYIADYEQDGALVALLKGSEVGPGPAVTYSLAKANTSTPSHLTAFNALSADGHRSYRVAAVKLPDGRLALIALPTQSIDATYGHVRLGIALVALFLVVMLALTGWWVVRLGLRPIKEVTDTAMAIAHGDLGRRVEAQPKGTEAGQLAEAFNVMVDERQAAEQRLRQFVADASHELRTPLATVAGVLELYRSGSLPDLDDALRRASEETDRMSILVTDLLLLAQLDQGLPLMTDPVDLARIVNDAAFDLTMRDPSRHVELSVSPDAVVVGDEASLCQVVANLVSNTLDHTPSNATVSLSAERLGDVCVLTVGDDGPGMSSDDAAHIFDRFFRVDDGRARSHGGSGLGLSIVASIVEAHHGTVSVDTVVGEGSTFRVVLPCTPPRVDQ